jgi:preprotein translocase subunit YajC
MEINWILLGIIAVFVIILVLFIIRVNQKDKKKYTNFLNNDFKKTPEEEVDSNDDNTY